MKKYLLYLIGFLCMSPFGVSALTATSSITCSNSSLNPGSETTCTYKGIASSGEVSSVDATISLTEGLELASVSVGSGWIGDANSERIQYYTDTNKSDTFVIATIKIKASSTIKSGSSETISITNASFGDEKFDTTSMSTISKTITVNSTVNTLTGLTLSNGTLSPTFSSGTTKYTSTINESSTNITATKTDTKSTISGTGKKTLDFGENTFVVKVTSQSGVIKKYTIVITRPDTREEINTLKTLSINNGSLIPAFASDTANYSVKVNSTVENITLSAETESEKASFVNGYGPRKVNLNYGDNNILIKVKAENGNVKTYKIVVSREDNRSSNISLSGITVSPGTLTFSKTQTEYTVNVPYETSSINIKATPEDAKSKVELTGNMKKLEFGTNEIKIVVTSETGDKKTYIINVIRSKHKNQVFSNNAFLSSLSVMGAPYVIDFDRDVAEYSLTIGYDINKLNFAYNPEDSSSTVFVEGNDDLKDGSVIKFTVTAQNGKTGTYIINITKEKEAPKVDINWTRVSAVLVTYFILLLGFIYALIIRRKNKSTF